LDSTFCQSIRQFQVVNSRSNCFGGLKDQDPILIDFSSGWKSGPIHEWYTSQPNTRFTSLEYRKELTGRFRHEFIVARLENGTCCRFDRRAKQYMRVHAVEDVGTIAEDTAQVICQIQPEYANVGEQSELVLSMRPKMRYEDLLFILAVAVCFSLKSNPDSRFYTATCYNCSSFRWTIFSITVRRSVSVAIVEEDVVPAARTHCESILSVILVPTGHRFGGVSLSEIL
jgi:hypothetical protein